ncbi:hypothetical protein BDN72DRAFT_779774 [Pluteus cervinus]|uniref:Uncharacterized protein n=1 Tax=Pluteus cervinus TaxID=181527 RepID=A0ACD3A2U9_9AGAR|nr:hypothetical protein BDN72DRAFT_779774 [Pluteus cervinus]
MESLQNAILSLEAPASIGQPCRCGKGNAIYRCVDCFHSPVLCSACIVVDHALNPFHRLEKWTGTYFSRTCMNDLGGAIHLGHNGRRCHNILPQSGRRLTIVHTTGIQTIFTTFCGCLGAKTDHLQLTEARLFPATVGRPDTALTFAFLEDLHIHVLTSKKSVYDHHSAIQRLTNAISPQCVPDRYHECGRVLRLWRTLTLTRRSGQTHHIDAYFPNRLPKSLAVRCAACPEIGFNVDKVVVDAAAETECHKYTLFLSLDGNFRLQRANKRHDPDDVALVDGHAYFVNDSRYREYLKGVAPSSENSTCAQLRAVRNQNTLKFKNAAITGVISVQCARHGFYMPQGTADLEKGEAYARSDYVLVRVLDEAGAQRWIVVSYDIWCQYRINLAKRVQQHFPDHLPILDHVRGAVPKMHVKGHMEECQLRWSFNYLPNSGETCGEKIETSWAEQNQSAGSTKQQNAGHRHDSLDDIFGFWNWNKLITLGRLTKNKERLDELSKSLSKSHSAAIVEGWRVEDTTPKKINGVWSSVYVARSRKGRPPSQLKAYQELIGQERIIALAGHRKVGDAQFISKGLRIEAEQCRIRALLASDDPSESSIASARLSLQGILGEWLKTQSGHFPTLRDSLPNPDLTTPEDVMLCLPSQWTVNRPHDLEHFVPVERALREGQCHDALDSLRTAIKTFNANYREKQTSIRGQHPNTRAQSFLNTLETDKVSAQDKYNRARLALLNLGLSLEDKSLQPLHKSQL